MQHQERAHSKFSASGSERWLSCPASVELEEKSPPSVDSFWSKEGTQGHELLEMVLTAKVVGKGYPLEMRTNVMKAAQKIWNIQKACDGKLLVEKKVFATFIHPDMFGTCDAIIAGNDGWLHIIDFKYGAGHVVSPDKNTQLIQYALSVAESYDWDFYKVKCWILQPRVSNDNWYKSWIVTTEDLKNFWLPVWQKGVDRVVKKKYKGPTPGSWCHWCRAKTTCPAKTEKRAQEISNVFASNPITKRGKNGL